MNTLVHWHGSGKIFDDANLELDKITSLSERLGTIIDLLDEKEMRWLELEEKK